MYATFIRTATLGKSRSKTAIYLSVYDKMGTKESPFCIYFTKLHHFYMGVCSRALHKLLQQEIAKQNVGNFVNFLNKHTETLFHLRGIRCCCNRKEYVVLSKDQWNDLFTKPMSPIHCPRNQQDCYHTYEAQRYLTVDKVDFSIACVLLRNICDPKYKNKIKIFQECRNEFIHKFPPPLDPNDFELLWRKAETSLCDVTNDLPEGKKQQISEDADTIYNYREMLTSYLENTVYEVKEYIKENLFSPIKVLDFVVNTLEQHGVAIIVGYPGSGKSYIGLEVMRTMGSKDKIVLKVDEVELWNRLVHSRLGYIVFIDDFLGESNLDSAKFTKLKKYFSTIYACVKNTETKVVLTVRKSIYEKWHDRLEETSPKLFEPHHVIDLTKEVHQMSNDEKKSVLMQHLQMANIQIVRTKKEAAESSNLVIDQFTVDAISGTFHFNFPLLCFLFTRSKNMRYWSKYFEHPRDTLVKTIDEFRKSHELREKKKYAVLSFCAISGNNINVSRCKLDRECMPLICTSLELRQIEGSNAVKVMVQDAVEDLKDEYLRQIDKETYEFVHQSILEATILSCGKVFPELVIEHCSKNTLFELIRTENYEEGKGELVLKLDEEYYDKLISRFLNEINTNLKVIPHVLLHPVMEDSTSGFCQQFLARLSSFVSAEETPPEVSHACLIESSKLGQLNTVKACLSFKFPQHVFETALNHASYSNRANVVVFLSTACATVKFDPYFLQACSFGCKDVVFAMIDNGIVQDVDRIQEGIVRSTKAHHVNISRGLIKDYRSKTDAWTFKKTMLKIIIDATEAGKADIVQEIISDKIVNLNEEDLITIILEACISNQLDLARFLLLKCCGSTVADLNSFVKCLLAGNRGSIDLVFDMKDFFQSGKFLSEKNFIGLHKFFGKENIDYLITSTGFGSYVIERALSCFPDDVESVCSSSDVIRHLLWIGGHSVVSKLCQRNPDLIQSLKKMEKLVDSYNFVEFSAFCGFPHIDLIAQECWHKRDSLFHHCIEGYKISGRLPGLEVELGYKNRHNAVNFFETTSRQRGYASCLKKLYNETIELTKDSPAMRSITKILCETFESDTFDTIRDFLNFRSTNTSRLFPISSAKMDVLHLLRHILLHHVDLMQVQAIFDS